MPARSVQPGDYLRRDGTRPVERVEPGTGKFARIYPAGRDAPSIHGLVVLVYREL